MEVGENNNQIKELKKRIIELETGQKLLLEALTNFIDEVKPNHDSFAYYALLREFTTEELASLENLLKQVALDIAFNNKYITKEEFTEKFYEIFPKDKYTLLSVIKALNVEGKHSYLCSLFLDGEQVEFD